MNGQQRRAGRNNLVLSICLLSLNLLACDRQTYRDVVQDFADRPIGELTAGTIVGQSFVPNHNRLTGVGVHMATFARVNRCDVVFRLRVEKSETDIVTKPLKCADVQDNSWIQIDFPAIKDSLKRKYVFLIESPNGAPGNAITIWMASMPGIYPDGQVLVNGKPIPGALKFVTFHEG